MQPCRKAFLILTSVGALLPSASYGVEPKNSQGATVEITGCAEKGMQLVAPNPEDSALVARVAARVLREVRDEELSAISDYAWPPEVCIHPTKVVNAFASLRTQMV